MVNGRKGAVAERMQEDLQGIIEQQPFFRGVDQGHIAILAKLACRVHFAPGHIIAQEGDDARHFYVVLRGKIELEAYVPPQGQVPIQAVGPGEALGWAWLFPPYQWHFTARVVEETDALVWETAELRAEADKDPRFGYELASRLAEVLHKRLSAAHAHLVGFYAPFPDE